MGNQHSYLSDKGMELNGSLMADSHGKIPLEEVVVCLGKRGIRIVFTSYAEKFIEYERVVEISSENTTPESTLTIDYLHGHLSVLTRSLKFLVESKHLHEMRDILSQHGMT